MRRLMAFALIVCIGTGCGDDKKLDFAETSCNLEATFA